MCGLAGLINLGSHALPDKGQLASMIGALQHRGPDGTGFYADAHVGLAHARLSIIDLATGDQPVHNEDRSVWVVFNGEIFNYIELRADLIRDGHSFYTQSDTEVLVHLYERDGVDFVRHLNGQFAIVLWDSRRRRLVIARDRTGIRPLFYSHAGGRLWFASEIKALFASGAIPQRLRPQGLAEVFSYWTALAPTTVFDQVELLPAGCRMIVEDGQVRTERYWDWQFPEDTAGREVSADALAEELRESLIEAVKLQLRSDVPVGAYLSGGLDSSIIVSIIARLHGSRLKTFSIGFEDKEFDEGAYQDEVVQKFGTQHVAIGCTRADIAAAFPDVVWHAETPLVRSAPAPLLLLAREVRRSGIKVVLTGEGADETFAGYDLFKEAKIRRFWARQQHSRLRPLALRRLYPYLAHGPGLSGEYSRRFFAQGMEHLHRPVFAHLPRLQATRRIWQFLSPELRSELRDFDPLAALEATLPQGMESWAPLSRDQYVEARTLLEGYLLSSQGDRMMMAGSIEGRFPFLDHHLVELAAKIPPRMKMRGLNEKYLLKRAFGADLPPSIASRTKQPYRAPDALSFFSGGGLVDYAEDLLSPTKIRSAGYFDAEAVSKLVAKFAEGRALGFGDNMAFIGILSTMLLDNQYVRRSSTFADAAAARAVG